MAHLAYHKPDLPILAPRPLKQSLGSPLTPRRPNFSQIEIPLSNDDLPSISTTKLLAVPSSRLPPESFEDKPEIRELYLEAEEELKEIVEGFTHTFVHNLLSREGGDRKTLWGGDEEDDDGFESDRSMLEDEYFSPFTSGAASRAETASPDIFAMEGLPRLGGSPSPMPAESLSSDIRNYAFLDDEEEYSHFSWDYYAEQADSEDGMYDDINEEEVEETRRLFNESRWMTETPPITRASNPVCKNSQFGRRLVVVTAKNVVAPSSPEEGERQRRKRIMSEPPQKAASFTSIECF